MEEKNREKTADEMVNGGENAGGKAPAEGETSQDAGGSPGMKKKIAVLAAVLILIGCACGWYYWNLPENRLTRLMQEADGFLASADYENAASGYAEAMKIDGANHAAAEGYLKAKMALAEDAAEKVGDDITGRARVSQMFEEIIAFCDEQTGDGEAAEGGSTVEAGAPVDGARNQEDAAGAEDTGVRDSQDQTTAGTGAPVSESSIDPQFAAMLDTYRESAVERQGQLLKGIAEDYNQVKCVTVRDDRSGRVILNDGTEVPYTWYYDQVRIEDEHYPLADRINIVLERDKEAFFAGENSNPSVNISGSGVAPGSEYLDYVGEAGIYSGKGVLSIRMAEIRAYGDARAGYFRGKTFRLSDGKELTLADVTDRTDSGVKHLVKKKIREWFEKEGYTSVSMTDAEEYIDKIDPKDLKFCIHEDGRVYLAIDQEVSFFATAGEILEIPLD